MAWLREQVVTALMLLAMRLDFEFFMHRCEEAVTIDNSEDLSLLATLIRARRDELELQLEQLNQGDEDDTDSDTPRGNTNTTTFH